MHIRTLGAAIATATALTLATPTLSLEGSVARATTVDQQTISVDFRGGALAEFVAAIRRGAGDLAVNIIYDPEFSQLHIAPIRLEQVYLRDALHIASHMSNTRPGLLPDGRKASWEVEVTGDGPGAPVFLLSVWVDEASEEGDEEHDQPYYEHSTVVHSLASLLTGPHPLTADAVLSSIQVAIDMTEQGDADLRFHADTGLLFARVTFDQARTVEQTIVRLNDSVSYMQHARTRSQFDQFLAEIGVESKDEAVRLIDESKLLSLQISDQQNTLKEMSNAMAMDSQARQRDHEHLEHEIRNLMAQLQQVRAFAEDLQRSNQRLEDERNTLRAELDSLRADRRPRE